MWVEQYNRSQMIEWCVERSDRNGQWEAWLLVVVVYIYKLAMITSFLSALWTLILDNPTFNNCLQSSLINVQCVVPTFTTAYKVWIGIVTVWYRSVAGETICPKRRSMPQKARIV